MAISRGPKLVTNGLVLALDPSDDNSFAAQNLPIKNGLILWLDAADDDSFVYSSGTVVSQWRDKSGLNNHVAQSTVGSQPNRNVVKNSRKSIYFDGGDSLFNAGDVFPSNTTDYTKIAVVYQTSTSNSGNVISSKTNNSGTNYAHAFYFGSSTAIKLWHSGQFVSSANDLALNTLGIVSGTYINSSGLGSLYVNGTASGTGTAGNRNIVRDIQIGAVVDNSFFIGEICEVLVFSRVLSATELKQVHNYLGQKWGILNTDRTIVDLSGNNNNGLLGNGTTADMPAFDTYNKGALKLDGTSDYIAVANATSLNPSTVTVSIWVKRNGYQSSVASYLRRNYNDAYAIIGDIAADNVRFRIHNGSTYPESPNATLSLNEWTNIVGTYDLNNIKIYKNGVFVNQTAHTSAISYSSANTVLTIGRDDPVAGRYMNANYGSVLIYNRALSAAEILQNYNAQKGKYLNTIVQQGLVLNLDAGNPYSYAGAGTTWYDTSGNNYNGALTFGPTYSSDNGGSIVFDGQNDYVSIPSNSNFNNGNNITVEAWVRCSNWGNFNHPMIVAKGINAEWILWKSNDVGVVGKLGWRAAGQAYSTTTLLDNVWYQCVGSVGSSGTKVYVNGILEGTNGTTVFTSGNIDVTIAAGLVSGSPSNILGANVAVTRIYNRQLTDSEVLQNYNATKSRYGL